MDQYYESKVNLQNNSYVPNVGEYWYKYKRNSTSVITILSSATDIRFKILNVDTLAVMYDSAKDDDTHKTRHRWKQRCLFIYNKIIRCALANYFWQNPSATSAQVAASGV